MHPIRISAAMLAGAGLLIGGAIAVPAMAADQAPAPQLAQAETYSDEKLQSFVMAVLDVEQIRQQYSAAFTAAETDDQRQQISEQAHAEMVQAVEAAPGISLEEYNEITQAVEADPALSQRVAEYMEPHMQ